MENTLQTMQHRRILFLISLPQTPEFEQDREDIEECLHELRKLNVDVCEHITSEDLAKANNYDIVVVVAHHDTDNDTLVLADGILKMSDFVNSLPADFKGVIDFSSCYSATAYQAIKNRCPQCRVQAALVEVRLLQRIIMYPSLMELLYEDTEIDYHDAYKEVAVAFEEFADSKKNGYEPEMTQLGQQMSSIYAPSAVKLNTPFQILVFFHYDSEREVVKVKAQRWQTNAIIRDDFEIPVQMKEGDKVTLTLSFDSTDNSHIAVGNGEYKKEVTIKKEMTSERFIVTVLPEFNGNGFLANVEMAKDDISFVRCAFNIDIAGQENKAPAEIVAEVPQSLEKAEDIITCYSDILTAHLFSNGRYMKFKSIIANKNKKDEEKLFYVRKSLYDKDFYFGHLNSFLQEKEDDLTELSHKDNRNSEITFELVPLFRNYIPKLQRKLNSLENKLKSIKKVKGKYVTYEEATQKFLPIESDFMLLASEIKNMDCQISMLKVFRELRDEIKYKCAKGIFRKDVIMDFVTQFLEYPHYNNIDKDLYDIFKNSDTKSIIHSRSKGATTSFMALVLAMVEGKYESIDKGRDDWAINVDRYLDLGSRYKTKDTLRSVKNKINKFVSLLGRKEVRDKIKRYQATQNGKISITAYYLLKTEVSII